MALLNRIGLVKRGLSARLGCALPLAAAVAALLPAWTARADVYPRLSEHDTDVILLVLAGLSFGPVLLVLAIIAGRKVLRGRNPVDILAEEAAQEKASGSFPVVSDVLDVPADASRGPDSKPD